MNVTIRTIKEADKEDWVRMRNLLWPGTLDDHIAETNKYFSEDGFYGAIEVFVAEKSPGELIGFIEVNVRNVVDGASSGNIPYVEGWYVDKDYRKGGIGKLLVTRASEWAMKKGYSELGSDTGIGNKNSIDAHTALGFREADRKICFIKKLP